MRKHSLVAILAATAWCVSAHAALPPSATNKMEKKQFAEGAVIGTQSQSQSAGPCGLQACAYFQDFDDTSDFTAGTWIGNGLNGAAGGIYTTWSATCSSNPANWPGGVVGTLAEGHVETANPFSGTQHVRISKDFNMLTNPFGCVVDARVPSNANAALTTLGPQTISAYLANHGGGAGANFSMQPQTPAQAMRTTTVLFFYYGTRYVLDRVPGGVTFTFAGFWDTTGAYEQYGIHTDPCVKFTCNGGANDAMPCANAAQCPGGTCRGRIDYSDGSGVYYSGQLWAGDRQDQILFYGDNTGGGAPIGLDIDDVNIDRSPNPCPQVCGDGDVTGSEQCDVGADTTCPGRCVAPGGTGANGEAECTCEIGPCSVSNDLPNGGPQTFSQHFGWWTFNADAPAYAVETCGTTQYDSALSVWEGNDCTTLVLAPGNHSSGVAYNDDCYGGPAFGDGSDPLASCYNAPNAIYAPYNACLCLSTNLGQQYWIWDPRVNINRETVITLTKRLACDNGDEFGACCDVWGDCTDVGGPGECSGVYTSRKLCSSVTCEVTAGACCDAFGDCVEVDNEAACSGTFQLGVRCADADCPATMGACCNRLTGTCTETSPSACTGNVVYSLGSHCSEVTCSAALGACCDSATGECSEVTNAECTGETQTWSKDVLCGDLDPPCQPPFIPTVSEWGLVIMALLLLVGAKVYFGRREALA